MAGLTKAQDDAGVAMSSGVSIRAGSSLDVTPTSGVSSMQTTPVKPEAGDTNDEATAKETASKQEMQKLQADFRKALAVIEEMKLEKNKTQAMKSGK